MSLRKWICMICVYALSVGTPAIEAAVYTVTGQIRTKVGANALANNTPVRYIRVIVVDKGPFIDIPQAIDYTDAAGNFSITFVNNVEPPDIFIDLLYFGQAISNRFVEIRRVNTDASPIHDTNIEGVVHNNIPAGTTALGTLRSSTKRANIITQVCSALRYLKGQFTNYILPRNLKAEGRSTAGGSFVDGGGTFMSVSFDDWATPGSNPNATFSDMHHETLHWVGYYAYGNRWPSPNCAGNPHFSSKESCEGFAMQEGSAQYFGNISAIALFAGDGKTNLPGPNTWRGQDGTGNDNNGEIVEGTFTRGLRTLNDHPNSLKVLTIMKPDSWREFMTNYAAIRGQSSAATRKLLDTMAANGIVYTRAKLTTFTPGDPPNVGPEQTGNFKIIRNIAFVRGKIKPTLQASTKAELHVAANSAVDPPDQKDLGYKPSVAGRNENNVFAPFTFIGAVPWASDLEWDTNPRSDGDHDLLAQARNFHLWWDMFRPSFQGDNTATVNTNEKWLKTLRTWYNQDNTPTTDKEGKVVVDNTSPEVSNFKPAP